MRILLVDDDADLLDVTAYALRREGFTILAATDGPRALQLWAEQRPDLVVLDVGLPRLGGLEVCRRVRQGGETPVILLTGQAAEEDVVRGFAAGADDYVTKPFSPRQLALRIRAVARRAGVPAEAGPAPTVAVGGLVLDVEAHEVRRGEEAVRLTPTEFRIFHLLASNPRRVVSSARLVEHAWGYDGGDASLLKTHISHLRTKLHLNGNGSGSIKSLASVGYRLDPGKAPD